MGNVEGRDAADRVRESTAEEINARLDREAERRVGEYATRGPEEITWRIGELDCEWDMERVLETAATAFYL